jgi:hypothetical protein
MSNSAQAATLEQRFRGTFNPCEQRFRGLRRQGSCRPREHDAIVIAERERTRHRHFIMETEKFGCRLSVCPVCTETPKPGQHRIHEAE